MSTLKQISEVSSAGIPDSLVSMCQDLPIKQREAVYESWRRPMEAVQDSKETTRLLQQHFSSNKGPKSLESRASAS